MSIKLYSFAVSNYDDCMKLTIKEFNELPEEEKQAIKTIIIPTGYGQTKLNFDGFNRLEHLYLPDDYCIIHNSYADFCNGKKYAHKCAEINEILKHTSNINFDCVNGYEIINESTEFKNTYLNKTVEQLKSLPSGNIDLRIIVCQLDEIQKIINEHTLNINIIKENLSILDDIKPL